MLGNKAALVALLTVCVVCGSFGFTSSYSTGTGGITKLGELDYHLPYAVRAMEEYTTCSTPPVWGISKKTLAERAEWVTLGLETAISVALNEKGAALLPSTEPNGAVNASDTDCWPKGYHNYEDARDFIASIEAIRQTNDPGRSKLKVPVMYRFDEVAFPIIATPGFRLDFLEDTARPWQEVLDFFSTDSDFVCSAMTGLVGYGCDNTPGGSPTSCESTCEYAGGGVETCSDSRSITAGRCGYNFCYSSFKVERTTDPGSPQQCQRNDVYLAALPGGTPTSYQTKIHYFPHQTGIVGGSEFVKRFPYASGFLTALENTEYQKWQIKRMTDIWELNSDWMHSLLLTYKGGMHFCREPWNTDSVHSKAHHKVKAWIGGGSDYECKGWSVDHYTTTDGSGGTGTNLTHASYVAGGGTPWSGEPTTLNWSSFIQGTVNITRGLRANKVPYSVTWSELTQWWRSNGGNGGYDANGDVIGVEAGGWNETGVCTYNPATGEFARCACDYSAATGTQRSDGWQSGDGTDMCDFDDDPSTKGTNENTLVLEFLRGARMVLLGSPSSMNAYSTNAYTAAVADLEAHGVTVIKAPGSIATYTDYMQGKPIP